MLQQGCKRLWGRTLSRARRLVRAKTSRPCQTRSNARRRRALKNTARTCTYIGRGCHHHPLLYDGEKMGKPRKYNKDSLAPAIQSSNTWAEVCVRLGLKPKTGSQSHLKKRAQSLSISFAHFQGCKMGGFAKNPRKRKALSEYLVKGSTIISSRLRKRLVESGLKKDECESCLRTRWLGQPIPLECHHINGEHTDCRLENLKILCPNCHAVETLYTGLAEQPDAALLESAALVA